MIGVTIAGSLVWINDTKASEQRDDYFIGTEHSEEWVEETFNIEISHEYESMNVLYATLSEEEVQTLTTESAIEYVEADQEVTVEQQTVPWSIEHVGAPTIHQTGFTGAGVDVAVLDTGVEVNHPDLNVIDGASFVHEDSHTDYNGHGTHVAGTIAALDNDYGVVGIAPDVNLYGVKVLTSNGGGSMHSIVQGIDWSVEQGMDVINLSLGSSMGSLVLEQAITSAETAGVVVVAAAGNAGASYGNESTVGYPAAYDSVLAVGATDQQDARAHFSSVGYELDVMAPGDGIYSTDLNGGYQTLSGTSMASPQVAGFAALLLQQNPERSPEEIRAIIKNTANPLGDSFEFGNGMINPSSSFQQ